jgi:TPR repeat protein
MSASPIKRLALTLLLAGCFGLAAAQDKPVDIEALKANAKQGSTRAMRQLGDMYYVGRGGVEQNFAEAVHWYTLLANRGDRRGQTLLGTMYARGYGVQKNPETARLWWLKAADKGDAGAQYDLGTLYYRGEGVAQDYKQAADWYNKASQIGHVNAQKNLAGMYWEGQGVEKNAQQAYFWFKVASLLGDDDSQDSLKIVAKVMKPGQLKEADEQADDWMKKYKKIVGQ